MEYTMKRIGLVLTLIAVLAFSFLLLNAIVFNHVDINLDFSLQGRIKHELGIREDTSSSLYVLQLLLLLGASLCTGTLVICQFITMHFREREILGERWMAATRVLQIILGGVAALLLTLIGVCMQSEMSLLPYTLAGALALRLVAYVLVRFLKRK